MSDAIPPRPDPHETRPLPAATVSPVPAATWSPLEAIPVFVAAVVLALMLGLIVVVMVKPCAPQFVLTTLVGELAFALAVLGWVRFVDHGPMAALGVPRRPLLDLGSGVLTGAALVFKQIGALADLMQNILLFLSGSLVPVAHFPGWLAAVARTLPITQGIIVLREVVLDGQSLPATWMNGSLVWLTVHSVLYCCGGWLVFKLCERVAKQQGSLGQY